MKDYKKILEGVVNIINTAEKSDIGFANICSYIGENCLELKESDGERIRKVLIDYFKRYKEQEECGVKTFYGIPTDDILAWLDTQGDKDKLIKELGEYKVKYTQETIGKYLNGVSKEDNERLRKTTISFLKEFADKGYENAVECIAWLEKQGEKPKDKIALEVINEKVVDNANKIEPSLEKGKWYVCISSRYTDFVVGNIYYCPQNGMLKPNEDSMARYVAKNCFRPWTIQDAKDGDVLADDTGFIMIVDESRDSKSGYRLSRHCAVRLDGTFTTDNVHTITDGLHPATKEQREKLKETMADAGYEFDFDKKELKKIEQKSDGWSTEDDKMLDKLEWLISSVDYCDSRKELSDWLKSLKHRNNWKPSEETKEPSIVKWARK